jgi:hypothetical protein
VAAPDTIWFLSSANNGDPVLQFLDEGGKVVDELPRNPRTP